MKAKRIAVLGAGIMGSSTAIFLARRGHHVALYDAAESPLSAASRWNEGKIHLGFLYSADPSMQTANEMIPGGLLFRPLFEELTGRKLETVTASDDIFLCHRDSVVSAAAMWDHSQRCAALVRQHPDATKYLVDVSECRGERLSSTALAALTDSPEIVAGMRVPERSVSTSWVADELGKTLLAEPGIEQWMGRFVTAVSPTSRDEKHGQWRVETTEGVSEPFDYVVNALWEGRMAVDLTAGIEPAGEWSHRYRLSLFVRTRDPVPAPSAVVTTGPFGDVKNYNNHDFYLSWYPAGLLVDTAEIRPPRAPCLDAVAKQQLSATILQKLANLLPSVAQIEQSVERAELHGGWVTAAGYGKLSDPKSTLHRRTDFGINRFGSYISVDTGKYSTAPWLAKKLAESID